MVQIAGDALWKAREGGFLGTAGWANPSAITYSEACSLLEDLWHSWQIEQRLAFLLAAHGTAVSLLVSTQLAKGPWASILGRYLGRLDYLRRRGIIGKDGTNIPAATMVRWAIEKLLEHVASPNIWKRWLAAERWDRCLSVGEQGDFYESFRSVWIKTERTPTGLLEPSDDSRKADSTSLCQSGPDNAVTAKGRLHVFCSYAASDKRYYVRFKKHCAAFLRGGRMELHAVEPGMNLDDVRGAIGRAEVIVFLVSADFLASDINDMFHVSFAMKRHRDGAAIVIPVFVRAVELPNDHPLAAAAPMGDDVAVGASRSQDKAWSEVVGRLGELMVS